MIAHPAALGPVQRWPAWRPTGKLSPGEPWRQEGILGSVFTGSILRDGERIIPFISGSAYVTAVASLIFQEEDPFRNGIPAGAGLSA